MAFPAGLSPRVDLMYSGAWQDITTDVLSRDGANSIAIQRGRQTEDGSITPATCALQIKNPTGKYSPRNPTSVLYGLIGRNTPVRVGVGRPPVALASNTSVDSTSLVAPSVTAEATGLQIVTWVATPGGNITTPGGFTAQTELDAGPITIGAARKASVAAGATGTATATHSVTATGQAAVNIHIPGATYVNAFTAFNTGGGDANRTSTTISAGQFAVIICVWSSDDENRMQPPKIEGDQGQGPFLLADSGSSTDTTIPRIMAWGWNCPTATPGEISLAGVRDSAGSAAITIFVMSGASAYYPRFVGEIGEFPVQWDKRGGDVFTPIEAAGVTRRIGSTGQESLRSAIYQAFTSRPRQIGYWPMEEIEGITFGNAISGGALGTFAPGGAAGNAPPQLAQYALFPGSESVPTFSAAGALLPLPTYTSTGVITAGLLIAVNAAGTANGANLFALECSGGNVAVVVLEYENSASIRLRIAYNDGTADFTLSIAYDLRSKRVALYVSLTDNGTGLDYAVRLRDFTTDLDPVAGAASGTRATTSIGLARRMTVGVEFGSGETLHTNAPAFGHPFVSIGPAGTVFNDQDDLGASSPRSLNGWQSESVHDRVRRLCTLRTVLSYVQHNAVSEALGTQRPGNFVDLLSEAETSDAGGQLFEPTGFLGYSYRTRESKENQSPRLTFDYSAGTLDAPLMPTDDDRNTLNDVTASRIGGSSARSEKTTGALSVLPPPLGVGRYADTFDLSLYTDSQCAGQASWRVNLGTIDEARWPSITFHLGATGNAAKVATMAYLDVGDMVRLTNLPAWVPPGPTDMLLEGYGERIGFTDWIIEANLSPAAGYVVGQFETVGYDRFGDNGTSTLTAGVTTTATSLSVATVAADPLWTTAGGDMPLPIMVAGELMTVTAISGATSPQTFTVTRSVNGVVKAQLIGAVVALYPPVYFAL